jgi:hypothetical protein
MSKNVQSFGLKSESTATTVVLGIAGDDMTSAPNDAAPFHSDIVLNVVLCKVTPSHTPCKNMIVSKRKLPFKPPYSYDALVHKIEHSLRIDKMNQTVVFKCCEGKANSECDKEMWRQIDSQEALNLFIEGYKPSKANNAINPNLHLFPDLFATVVARVHLNNTSSGSQHANNKSRSSTQKKLLPKHLQPTRVAAGIQSTSLAGVRSSAKQFQTKSCKYYNYGNCHKKTCKFIHCCKHCGGGHPKLDFCHLPRCSSVYMQFMEQQPFAPETVSQQLFICQSVPDDGSEEKQNQVVDQKAGVAEEITSTSTTPSHTATTSTYTHSNNNDGFTPCVQWNRDGLCPLQAQCPHLHECATCKSSTHAQFACPETKFYRCKYCNVLVTGFCRYKIHCETEEHISREQTAEQNNTDGEGV